jgi:hypothetical protein
MVWRALAWKPNSLDAAGGDFRRIAAMLTQVLNTGKEMTSVT